MPTKKGFRAIRYADGVAEPTGAGATTEMARVIKMHSTYSPTICSSGFLADIGLVDSTTNSRVYLSTGAEARWIVAINIGTVYDHKRVFVGTVNGTSYIMFGSAGFLYTLNYALKSLVGALFIGVPFTNPVGLTDSNGYLILWGCHR